jgi:hypothetical protein
MKTRVLTALPPEAGSIFTYEYDYGSTTALRIELVGRRHAPARRDAVRLLARNDAPLWKCSTCGKPATSVCAYCFPTDQIFMCKTHTKRHGCEENIFMPVVNSPRMGVCAYVG